MQASKCTQCGSVFGLKTGTAVENGGLGTLFFQGFNNLFIITKTNVGSQECLAMIESVKCLLSLVIKPPSIAFNTAIPVMSHVQSHSILTISLNRGFCFFLENLFTQLIYTHSCSLQMSPTNLRRSARIFGDLKPWPAQCALRIKDMSGITMATERNSALSSGGSSKLFPLVQIVKKTEKFGFTMIYEIKQNIHYKILVNIRTFFTIVPPIFCYQVITRVQMVPLSHPKFFFFSEAAVNSI